MFVHSKNLFDEYCSKGSVHGFVYISSVFSWIERVAWLALIVIMLTLASFVVDQALTHWEENPTQGKNI